MQSGINLESKTITQDPGGAVEVPTISLPRHVWLLAAVWTGVAILSLAGNLYLYRQATLEVAWAAGRQQVFIIWLSHSLLWLLGLGGIGLASARLGKRLARQKRTETDLQEANQILGAVMMAAPLAIVSLDAQGCVRLWNPAAESIFGWRSSEVVGQQLPFLSENQPSDFPELYSRGLRGESVRGEGRCRHRNGMVMDFSFSMSPRYGPRNEISGAIAVLEDITDRRQTEDELFKANEKLKVWVYEFGRRNRDITLLNAMGDLLQACQTVQEVYAGVVQYISRMFPDVSGALFILNREKNALAAVAKWGGQQPGAEIFSPDACWALRIGHEHLVQEPGSALVCQHLPESSQGYLCAPMIAHGETLGLLLLLSDPQETSPGETLNESKQRLASLATRQIALSLANLNLRNSLLQQAIRDPLTGLFNRRYLEEILEREILRVQRKNAPLGIIMLDLDLFKHYNDTYGHEAGDTLLQTLSSYLQANIRQEDVVCRYGGEEFLLIMPEASLETTRQRAEKLRQGTQDLQVEYQGRVLGPVNVSLGVAVFPDHGASGEEVIRAADLALYRAKEGGRNRVVTAAED